MYDHVQFVCSAAMVITAYRFYKTKTEASTLTMGVHTINYLNTKQLVSYWETQNHSKLVTNTELYLDEPDRQVEQQGYSYTGPMNNHPGGKSKVNPLYKAHTRLLHNQLTV